MSKKRVLTIIGIVVAVVVIAVLSNAVLVNHRPAITSLEADPDRVLPSGTCQIICNATDSDGDELSYGWSAAAGTISGQGATVTWTAPSPAGSYNITVIVTDGRGGTATGHVDITVRRNSAPTINALVANADWALPSGSLNVTCDAKDSDGDELTYEWTVTGGNIAGTGSEVVWNAPQDLGVYNITLLVSDGHGSADTRTLHVTVVTGQPPTIEALVVTAEHCYLKSYSWGYKVGKGQAFDIECVVADTASELSYEWICAGGEKSGDGSIIGWTAPQTPGKVTVTVIVSDIANNKGVKDLLLEVASCNTCSFPGCSG
ncbi:MAG: PKD domain-containing protein [Dehalococcoidia bacterium]|nr:PKD domain-containing protein [Dehalococcoidia bacterium]MDH4299528.1 PKD domain-containing protein [Dehalococcoidia bacterium]